MQDPAPIDNHHSHLPHWLVILLLLFIPPIGWWHMWKNHRYHSWFPYLLWLNAAIMLGFAAYVVTHFYPLITKVFDSSTYIFASHIGLLLLAGVEIVFGFYLIKMFRDKAVLRRKILAIIIVFLFINTIAIPLSQLVITSLVKNQSTKEPAVVTNQNSIANWKTYTNDKFSYSLQYPPDAVLYEGKQASTDGQYSSAPNSIQLQLPDGIFTIAVSDHIDDITEFGTPNVFYSNVKRKKITFKGLEAYELLETTFGLYGTEEIGVQKNTLYYLFRGEPSFNETTDQILSTFKFLDYKKRDVSTRESQSLHDCNDSDTEFCNYLFLIQNDIESQNYTSLINKLPTKIITCDNFNKDYYSKVCDGIAENQKITSYYVGLFDADGHNFTHNQLLSELKTYFDEGEEKVSYHGYIKEDTSAVMVYFDKAKNFMVYFGIKKKNNDWKVDSIARGYIDGDSVSDEIINLDKKYFGY